ncbi:MAG TPA: exodeoxyribonuclease V subunit alpha [Acidimicrobiales bacterium]|nr:exodeoxyribonuclease V subunit alpha [Acidimicrobiales bacterium]
MSAPSAAPPGPGRTAGGVDPLDADFVLGVDEAGLIGAFNRAGVLAPADVHVALRLGRLGGDGDGLVALAAALAVRAPRVGHVLVDLATVRATAASEAEDDVDFESLPWPEPGEWVGRVAASPLVSAGPDGPDDRPLRLVGTALYLARYWRDEGAVAADLLARSRAAGPTVDGQVLAAGLDRLFPDDAGGEQRRAAEAAVRRRLAVIAGGPGTGKTTTVARVLALLEEQAAAAGSRPPLVALVAPTGKAAARMAEAVRAEAARMDVGPAVRERLTALDASTVHRLLVRHPGNASRFRHHRHNRLPHDVVVVDETSMVSLWLMARLAEAVRPDARLVLVGDPQQLTSVEAGAVLGDIVAAPALGEGIAPLRSNHRFHGALAELATAIQAGDAEAAVAVLGAGAAEVGWIPVDVTTAPASALGPVREVVCSAGVALVEAARAGDASSALEALGRFRLLCAHRRGPAGVAVWNPRIEEWLSAEIEGFSSDGAWYVGRPVIVTANDYSLRLFNGDTGVVVAREGGVGVAFRRGGAVVQVSPSRLAAVDTVFAMTVHKSQGSEFDEVVVVLPDPSSRIMTRELLYTAVTRARQRVTVVGTADAVRAAVERPVARASGLTGRLSAIVTA